MEFDKLYYGKEANSTVYNLSLQALNELMQLYVTKQNLKKWNL